jgi:hypothetical protein
MKSVFAGTAARLLCLPISLLMLTSCNGGGHGDARAQARFSEMQADIQGVMKNASTHTGAPIHVDPYVHSAGSHPPHKPGDHKGC